MVVLAAFAPRTTTILIVQLFASNARAAYAVAENAHELVVRENI